MKRNIIPDHVHTLAAFRAHNRSLDRASMYAKIAVLLPIFAWFFLILSVAIGHPPTVDFFVTVSITCAQLLLSFFAVLIVSEFVCE